MFLRSGFGEVYVSCGLGAKNKQHYAMTPELDVLYGSEHMKIVHYGCNADKLQKLKELAEFPIAMQTLRVCWVNRNNAYNCSMCEKCMRNMLGLYICNGLQKCKTFEKNIDVNRLRNIKATEIELKFFRPILAAFDKKGDTSDVRMALFSMIQKNSSRSMYQKFIRALRNNMHAVDKKYNRSRIYWFMTNRGYI